MAKGYRPVLRDQPFLLPPDMRDWLPPGHPVHLVIEVVDHHLDTSAVYATRRPGRAGRESEGAGARPAGRRRCGGAARPVVLSQASAAAVRSRERFDQVLILCAKRGMGRLGVIALDGTKVKASA